MKRSIESRTSIGRRAHLCRASLPLGAFLILTIMFGAWSQSAHAQCGPGAGDCCFSNNSPGCEDVACCQSVCAVDPFCCEVEWDSLCADETCSQCFEVCDAGLCGNPDCLVFNDCCCDHGDLGCHDDACETLICAEDPFCCDVAWDSLCADAAQEQCTVCNGIPCGPGAGSCCLPNESPGCEDESCCEAVCAQNPLCCEAEWNSDCVTLAFALCSDCLGQPCGMGIGSCCTPHDTPGCEDESCCETICAEDPFCCDVAWDALCADAAQLVCEECTPGPHCGDPTLGDCCEANETTHCEDEECCETVCAVDPFCCEVAWDGICADFAHDLCPELCPTGPAVCGDPKSGDCCFFDGPPGCYNKQCCEAVCAQDPFCCEVAWDRGCVMIVIESPQCPGSCIIELCPHDASGDCCMGHGGLGCEDDACCESVCSMDPFCCEVEWDDICADHAHEHCDMCVPEPDSGCSLGFWKNHPEHWVGYSPDEIFDEVFIVTAGIDTNCCEPHGGTGCDDPACEEQICAQDPFCCDVQWDAICANDASAMCEVCMIVDPAPLDVFGDATLHEVISSRSGGPNAQGPTPHHNNLGKQAVAALLNAASSVAYPWTENEVIDAVTEAFLARDPEAMNALKDELDDLNNLGCPSFDPADITGPNGEPDGVVDVHDLLEVLNHWGEVDDAQPADLNGDGVVNSTDLIMLLNNWGETHPQWTEFE